MTTRPNRLISSAATGSWTGGRSTHRSPTRTSPCSSTRGRSARRAGEVLELRGPEPRAHRGRAARAPSPRARRCTRVRGTTARGAAAAGGRRLRADTLILLRRPAEEHDVVSAAEGSGRASCSRLMSTSWVDARGVPRRSSGHGGRPLARHRGVLASSGRRAGSARAQTAVGGPRTQHDVFDARSRRASASASTRAATRRGPDVADRVPRAARIRPPVSLNRRPLPGVDHRHCGATTGRALALGRRVTFAARASVLGASEAPPETDGGIEAVGPTPTARSQ